jgi:hypothetical protein
MVCSSKDEPPKSEDSEDPISYRPYASLLMLIRVITGAAFRAFRRRQATADWT